MAQEHEQDRKSPSAASPWDPANDAREAVAPSKPSMPVTGSVPIVPQSIEGEDGEIIAPVPQPDGAEIMPEAGTNPWQPRDSSPYAGSADAIQELGDSAVRSASLSASGAPTPLAGVPVVTGAQQTTFEPEDGPSSVAPAWVAGDPRIDAPDSASQWSNRTPPEAASGSTPASAPSAEPGTVPYSPVSTGTPSSPGTPASIASPASAPSAASVESPASQPSSPSVPSADSAADAGIPDFSDGTPAYVPPVLPGDSTDGGSPEEPRDTAGDDKSPWYTSAAFLIVVGLLCLGGIGYGAYVLFFAQDDVELAPEVLVEAPAQATVDPITLEEPSEFLAAMPAIVGTYAMTAATPVPTTDAGLDVRAAEVNDLVYSDGTNDITVRAIQHYNAEAATEQFTALSEGGTDPQPVEVGGATVGDSVTIAGENPGKVWRNGTAVFVLSGPADAVETFYENFGF